jgi:SnoaL-like domain
MSEACASVESMLLDQWTCQQQLLTFMQLMDAGNADAAAALLTPDAQWNRQGQIVEGAEAIGAVIAARSPDRIVRHHLCNLVVTLEGSDRASSRAYYAAYISHGSEKTRFAGLPERSGDYYADFVRTTLGWRISHLRAHRLFEAGGQPTGRP